MVSEPIFRASAIVEVIGAPEEHAVKAMKQLMEKLNEEKDIDLKEGKVHKPKPLGVFFTLYAELELTFKNFETLTHFCFEYMPSSIEISEPADFNVKASDISGFINDLMARLHDVDMKLKNLSARSQVIDRNALNVMKNAVLISISEKPKTLMQLSRELGIEAVHLEKFLDNFVKEGQFAKEGDQYLKK